MVPHPFCKTPVMLLMPLIHMKVLAAYQGNDLEISLSHMDMTESREKIIKLIIIKKIRRLQ